MPNDDQRWRDVCRIESWAGEVRVNVIRLAGIVLFYLNHLWSVYSSGTLSATAVQHHSAVTAIVVAWSAVVVALHLCLSRRWSPWWLKYAASFADVLLISCLLVVGGDPSSRVAILYFLVIGSAPLRMSLRLVQVVTLGIMAVYVVFQAYAWWAWRTGDVNSAHGHVLFLLALGAAGLMAGQVVRQMQRIVRGYPVSVADKESA